VVKPGTLDCAMRVLVPVLLVAVIGLSGCAGGSEPTTGGAESGGSEQTTDGSDVPDSWAGFGDTPAQPTGTALTEAEERISGTERAQVVEAARQVESALRRWDARVEACAVDIWTSCLSQPRRSLLLELLGAEGKLRRGRGTPEGPCRAGARSAYESVYGFRLSQARADYSDPAPGTAPSGDPDLAILQVAVNQLRHLPGSLEALAATACEA
jgi:hypothetical protein